MATTTSKSSSKREKQTRYLSQAIQLEEAVNPHIIRSTMTMVSLAILAFLVWAAFAHVSEVARTPGEIVPHGYQQTVQHFEGGLVKAIYADEGDVVEKNQVLVLLGDVSVEQDLERVKAKELSLDITAERLRAFLAGRNPDFTQFPGITQNMITDQMAFFSGLRNARLQEGEIIRKQIAQKEQAISSLKAELQTVQETFSIVDTVYHRYADLYRQGAAAEMEVLAQKQSVNALRGDINRLENQIITAKTEFSEYKDRLASLNARHHDETHEKLDRVLAERTQNRDVIEKLEERVSRLKLRAPVRGFVKGVAVNTIGAVVQSGETIMEIVPLDKQLVAEINISPQDIGHVQVGQSVQVKFSTYDFSRYGFVKGKLEHVSATTFSDAKGERFYRGRILLDRSYVGDDPNNLILPGMTVMADVITGEKTILQYLLKPIHASVQTSFTER
ncbi:MAG: HlyD family type I secretion periplasmic adaptor subunit [Pseudomonadota bacterium]